MMTNGDISVSRSAAIVAFSLGCLFFCYAFIQRVAPSIMTQELMWDFGVGGAALGSLSAFYFWTYASIQLPVGILTDRFGPRKLMCVAAAICGVAALGFAWSESLILASFWRAIIGGTVAFGFVGTLAIAAYWFKHSQMALLAGVLQSLGMCGAVFAQAPMRPLVESYGWRNTMAGLAIVAVVISVLIFKLVPKRTETQKRSETKTGVFAGLNTVVRNPQSWLVAIFGFGMASTMLAFSGLWAVPWLSTVHGYSPTQAAAITSSLFIGWAIASPIVGLISDRIGKRNTPMRWGATLYILFFSIILFATPSSISALVVLLLLTGAAGSTMTVGFISAKELNDPQHGSTAVGLMNMFVVGSGAVMQPLIGWLLDLNWSGETLDGARIYSNQAYTAGFISLLVVMFAAWICAFLLRETNAQQSRQ